MTILATIVVGAIIGWLASLIGKTSHQMGCLWNVLVGVAGAWLGHWLARHLFDDVTFEKFTVNGLLVSLGGAVLLVLALRVLGILKRNR